MPPGSAIGLAVAALLPLGLGLLRPWRQLRQRRRLLEVTRVETLRHARLLLVKQKQLVIHDGYGNYKLDDWIRHANYFIDNVILRQAKAQGIDVEATGPGTKLRDAVTRTFLALLNSHPSAGEPEPDAGPPGIAPGQAYEVRCHDILRQQGWSVSLTPVTGDQGADLIADSGGRRLVLQCKCHAKPVGNKAVQEAFGALKMHGGDQAVVVSASGFTRSAEVLARVNGVLLVHHDQLAGLRERR